VLTRCLPSGEKASDVTTLQRWPSRGAAGPDVGADSFDCSLAVSTSPNLSEKATRLLLLLKIAAVTFLGECLQSKTEAAFALWVMDECSNPGNCGDVHPHCLQ